MKAIIRELPSTCAVLGAVVFFGICFGNALAAIVASHPWRAL